MKIKIKKSSKALISVTVRYLIVKILRKSQLEQIFLKGKSEGDSQSGKDVCR